MPLCVIKGHSKPIWSLTYLGTSGNIMSTSEDSSIRQWKRDGELVGKPLDNEGGGIGSMSLSPDETMVVCGSADGRLRLWNIKKATLIGDPWEGHKAPVRSLDWSPNALGIISGSEDGTIRRWKPNTGRQIGPPIETSHGWVLAIKYSSQGEKFASVGDSVICIWSREGELLVEIKGHDGWVMSLCWSKDGAHIFSGSLDNTIRKWRSIDGQELIVFQGHTNPVRSLCLSLDESYIISASNDCSIRIWDLKANQPVGDPLLHDDELLTVAISPDGKDIVSAGLDKKIYVWSLEAALKAVDADEQNTEVKGHRAQPRVARQPIQAKKIGLTKYGNDFFRNESDHAPRRTAPPASSLSLIHWRHLLNSIHFGTRPANASQPIERQSRHWNFNLFPGGNSMHTVNVAPARDEDRYGITPESDAEAAAAMHRTDGSDIDNSTQPGRSEVGAHTFHGRPIYTQAQDSTGRAETILYEGVSCCGFFFGRRRSTSPRS